MYVQFKDGFVECDQWDGTKTGDVKHDRALAAAKKRGGLTVIVVRSRSRKTISACATRAGVGRLTPLESPPTWDYKWRIYLSLVEFISMLEHVADDLDYRNFKSWCKENSPKQARLAHEIWNDAHLEGDVP